MVPVVMGAIAIGSALAQYLSSKEAAALSAEERQKLETMLQNVQSPNFDWSQLDPEAYKVVAKYQPQVASFIEEQAPQLVTMDSADSQAAREAQRTALAQLRARAQGQDPLADAELADALDAAAVTNRGRNSAIKEDFARRGQGGGVAEMLAQIMGTQNANQAAADNSRSAFVEAQRRKLQAMRDSSTLAGAIRDDEFRTEKGNDDIINSFNQRTSVRKQDWANNAAETNNAAQRFNNSNAQDIANKNTGTSNNFATQERDRIDGQKQRVFENEMSKVKTYAGITDMARTDARQNARDTNSAIAGAAEGVGTVAAYNTGRQPPKEENGYVNATQNLSAQPRYASEEFDDENDDPLKRRYNSGRATA